MGNAAAARDYELKAAEMLSEARDSLDGPIYRFQVAWVYAVTGDKDQALAALTKLFQGVAPFTVHDIRVIPGFGNLRGDRRFEALLNNPKNNLPLF